MTSGDEIRRARERAGLTQEQLASRVGVTPRTVGNWERGATVPRNRLATVQAALADHLDSVDTEPRLRGASDVELLAEIARRLTRTYSGEDVTGNAQHPASIDVVREAVDDPGERPDDTLAETAIPEQHPGPGLAART